MGEYSFTPELAADLVSEFGLQLSPDDLLDALSRAAALHDEEVRLFHFLKSMPEERACYERLAGHVHAALVEWRQMREDSRHWLAWSAHASGHLQWLDWPEFGAHVPEEEIADQVDSALADLGTTVETVMESLAVPEEGNPGTSRSGAAKQPLHGLFAFATELKELWESATETRFGQGFEDDGDGLEPVTQASKFFCRCAERLSTSYTTASLRTAMRRVQQGSGVGWSKRPKGS